MKQKIFRLLTFMMVLTLVVTPVSATSFTDDVETVVDSPDLTPMAATGLQVSETGLYVVQLSDPSLARYTGGIDGLAATSLSVTGASKLDVSAPASVAYLSYLEGKQAEFISQMNAALGRSVEVPFQYLNALNALAVEVSHAEAEILVELPDVVAVYADSLREIETDVGPILIGAPAIWEGDHQLFSFFSALSGDNEVPPVPSDASGEGTFTYDPTTNELTWEISHDLEMADVTAAHIHLGAVGENGPAIITLDHTENPMVGSEILTDEQQGWLMNHLLYVNVHTTAYPGGEIRDQLWKSGHRGEGVIVGMLDTGVNPFHQSFAAVDGDGYVHE
ncbi:MAG: CHRD domain-containing protein, partial [Anaerolineales bacterium]|nr:CHRD domain-containing protein [Anaerolineales bacterium]